MAKLSVQVSPAWTLIKEDLKSLLTGALVAGVGALLTYLADNITKITMGSFIPAELLPIITAIAAILANFFRKLANQTTYVK